jgi:hypothetical protein
METWKTIPNWEDYQVSNLGRVRSLKTGNPKELKLLNIRQYKVVNLCKEGKKKLFSIQQLVAMAFLNHKPEGWQLVVDHINSDKSDNRLENLRIVTNRENCSKERVLKSSLPVGVDYKKDSKKFRALIQISGKRKYLGLFNTPEEASEAYQKELNKVKQT